MYVERNLEKKIIKYLNAPEIIAILGPRQSGKTTLLSHIYSQCSKATFISFEDPFLLS